MSQFPVNVLTNRCCLESNMSSRQEMMGTALNRLCSKEPKDLVFVCQGGQQVSCHSMLACLLFSVVRDVVGKVFTASTFMFTNQPVKIFLTLEGVRAATLDRLIRSVYEKSSISLSSFERLEVGFILNMLGAQGKLFSENKEWLKVHDPFKLNSASIDEDYEQEKYAEMGNADIKRKRKAPMEMRNKKIRNYETSESGEDDYSTTNTINEINGSASLPVLRSLPNQNISVAKTSNKDETGSLPHLGNGSVSIVKQPFDVVNTKSMKSNITAPFVNSTIRSTNQNPALKNLPSGVTMTSIKPTLHEEELEDKENLHTRARVQNLLPGISVSSFKTDEIKNLGPKTIQAIHKNSQRENVVISNFKDAMAITNGTMKPEQPMDSQDVREPNMTYNPKSSYNTIEGMETESAMTDITSALQCPITGCKSGKTFKHRFELIVHLSQSHYGKELLEIYPFIKGSPCQICKNQGNSKVLSTKQSYLLHVGATHEVVLDLLPAELKIILQALVKGKGRKSSRRDTLREADRSFDHGEDSNPPGYGNEEEDYNLSNSFDNYNYNEDGSSRKNSSHYDEEANWNTSSVPDYTDQDHGEKSSVPDYHESDSLTTPVPNYMEESTFKTSVPNYLEEPSSNAAAPDYMEDSSLDTAAPPYRDNLNFKTSVPDYTEDSSFKTAESDYTEEDPDHMSSIDLKDTLPATELSCHLCSQRQFSRLEDLLFHFSFSHFSKDLLELVPFAVGAQCSICHEEGNTFVLQSKLSAHLTHVGVHHKKVLDLLPGQLAISLRKMEEKTEVIFSNVETSEDHGKESTEDFGNETEDQNMTSRNQLQGNEDGSGIEGTSYVDDTLEILAKDKLTTGNNEEENITKHGAQITATSADNTEGVTGINESPKKKETDNSIVGARCPLCPVSKIKEYIKRSDLLKHLALSHFGKQILSSFPHIEGQPCGLCMEISGKSWSTPRREVHVCHVGVLHAKVFDFLSDDLLETVKSMPTVKRGRPGGKNEDKNNADESKNEDNKEGITEEKRKSLSTIGSGDATVVDMEVERNSEVETDYANLDEYKNVNEENESNENHSETLNEETLDQSLSQ